MTSPLANGACETARHQARQHVPPRAGQVEVIRRHGYRQKYGKSWYTVLDVHEHRAAFQVGENLLIEEKEVVVRAGQMADVAFDGQRALSVPLPKSDGEVSVSGAAVRRGPR